MISASVTIESLAAIREDKTVDLQLVWGESVSVVLYMLFGCTFVLLISRLPSTTCVRQRAKILA